MTQLHGCFVVNLTPLLLKSHPSYSPSPPSSLLLLSRALFAHHESSPNVIECVGDGSGDMRDMVDLMDDAQFMYCLGKPPNNFPVYCVHLFLTLMKCEYNSIQMCPSPLFTCIHIV